MPTFTAPDGTSLFYREWGAGAPVLFLNSWGMTTDMWAYQFEAFAAAGYRCIGFDRRGHGRSDVPGHGYDFDTFADDMAALMTTLDLTGVILIGHSMGGGEAVRYLTRHGAGRVVRIVMLAPTTPMPVRGEDGNRHGFARADFEAVWATWRQDFDKWIDDNLAPFFVPEISRSMMNWVRGLFRISYEVALACNKAVVNSDFRDELPRIDRPVLLIHGDRDRSMPIEMSGQPTAELLPDCRLLTYRDAPHGLMFTHRDRLHADVLGFIEES